MAALEEQVRLICQMTGVPFNLDASEIPADVRALVEAGERLDAVRRHRELTGADLVTAQRTIDSI